MLFQNFSNKTLGFGKRYNDINIRIRMECEGCEDWGFCNLKRALSTVEGL